MKKLILIAVVICFNMASFAQKIVVKGSDTVLPLSQKEAEEFMKKNPAQGITVIGGGSGVGIAALLDNSTDIAMSSRPLKMDERMKLQDAGRAFKEVTIAFDALSVIVNPENKVGKLTREQLEGIYTGKITNWKEVGGDDLKIIVYSRESSSGTYEFFKEHVMNRKNYASSVLNMPATGAIVQSVSQTKGAIGYIGLAYMEKTVKAIEVSYDKGKTYVTPSFENAKNHTYPIVRPLFYYYNTSLEKKVKSFIDFILSPEGQKIVQQVGYVTL
ncbi:MAG TPA: PstS family phosphate ABC transporter substrate-binding protein [Chitinophagales bacterium]|nr:PstS family phosphate ABC transporter substrate-binding protein [Chitinophagales bacterium]